MKKIELNSYAKINLILDVLGKRLDGYHEVVTILQRIALFDRITLTKEKKGIKINCNNKKIPTDEGNIAYKAAKILFGKYGIADGVNINIKKRIPVAAGFGGGSSNAATVLLGLNELFDLSLSKNELFEIAVPIGVDVPFFLQDKICLATGKGEKLKPLKDKPNFDIILVVPNIEFSLGFKKSMWVYKLIDKEEIIHPNTSRMIKCFENRDWDGVVQNLGNVFEQVMFKEFPITRTIKEKLMECGCLNAAMTGTGPTLFGIMDSGIFTKIKRYGNIILTKTV